MLDVLLHHPYAYACRPLDLEDPYHLEVVLLVHLDLDRYHLEEAYHLEVVHPLVQLLQLMGQHLEEVEPFRLHPCQHLEVVRLDPYHLEEVLLVHPDLDPYHLEEVLLVHLDLVQNHPLDLVHLP